MSKAALLDRRESAAPAGPARQAVRRTGASRVCCLLRGVVLAAALAVLAAAPGRLWSQAECLACHGDKTMQDANGHSIAVDLHGSGAHLDNLETHDERQILPNTCFSVEPGIYLPPGFASNGQPQFGIRSEVNMLTTAGKAWVTGPRQQLRHLPGTMELSWLCNRARLISLGFNPDESCRKSRKKRLGFSPCAISSAPQNFQSSAPTFARARWIVILSILLERQIRPPVIVYQF